MGLFKKTHISQWLNVEETEEDLDVVSVETEADVETVVDEVVTVDVAAEAEGVAVDEVETETRKSGPHAQSSDVLSSLARSRTWNTFTSTHSQSRNRKSLTTSLAHQTVTPRLVSRKNACRSTLSRSRPRPVTVFDSRHSSRSATATATSALAPSAPRKLPTPSRVHRRTQSLTLSRSVEDTGAPVLVFHTPCRASSRPSAARR